MPTPNPSTAATATQRDLPIQTRLAGAEDVFRPASANEDKRTVEMVWSTGVRVRRNGFLPDGSGYGPYDEELSMEPGAVDLSRMNDGRAPVLDAHFNGSMDHQLGTVVPGSAEIRKGLGVCTARFRDTEKAAEVFRSIVDGTVGNVSVGYSVGAYEVTREDGQVPLFRATRWTPMEVSMVPIGADQHAGTRSQNETTTPCEIVHRAAAGQSNEEIMTTKSNTKGGSAADSKTREADIRAAVTAMGMETEFADELVASGASVQEARNAIINRRADKDAETEIRSHYPTEGFDNPDFRTRAMSEALAARFIPGHKPSEPARQFMGASLMGMATEILQGRGEYRTGMNKAQIVERALGTTDFPNLLMGTGTRILASGYEAAPSGIKPLARMRQVDDFRAISAIRLSEAPELLEVKEHGEVKHGAAAEAKESYRIKSYARIFSLTREAIINDDLGAFADQMSWMGRAAAEKEAALFYDLLSSNPTMDEDNTALFHADHGNLAGSGGAISVTTLGTARKALRSMTGLDGKTPINATPAFLLVGPEKETEAEQVLADIAAAKAADANPFSGRLQLLVEPRLGTSKNWFVFANPATLPVFEYAYLAGQEGPQMDSQVGFKVLGMEFRVTLDFGCGTVDWRGAYKNPGA